MSIVNVNIIELKLKCHNQTLVFNWKWTETGNRPFVTTISGTHRGNASYGILAWM